jgi:predicted Zn-dependent protease
VATQDRTVVADGVVQGYFLSTYTARKLGMPTTGSLRAPMRPPILPVCSRPSARVSWSPRCWGTVSIT